MVCDSKLELKEEFMNPSHIELYKVYPKNWKGTNKLLTDYYYPKDYTKCNIFDVTYIPSEDGEEITSSDFQINVDTTKKYDFQLLGNTQQDGTPTPDNPVDIDVVTGRQEINVVGKNLFDKNNVQIKTGASFNGTDGHVFSTTSNVYQSFVLVKVKPNSTIIFTQNKNKDLYTAEFYISYLRNQTTEAGFANGFYQSGRTITTNANTQYLGVVIRVKNTNSDVVSSTQELIDSLDLQFEYGNTATEYEKYRGQSYEVNLGKNLFDKDNANVLEGYFSGAGTTTIVSHNYHRIVYIPCSPNTTYTAQKINQGSNKRFALATSEEVPVLNGTIMQSTGQQNNQDSLTITTNSTAHYLLVWCYVTNDTEVTFDEILDSIQIEVGSTATDYSSYFTPIELCKIRDYQDYIKKSKGKNLFDKDNDNIINVYINANGVISNSDTRSFYIPIDGGKTYTIQKYGSARFRIGTTTTIPENGVSIIDYSYTDTDGSITITTSSSAKYLVCYFYATFDTNTKTQSEVLNTIQVELGSSSTDLEPYGVGKWYKYRRIGKGVLDGSETDWSRQGAASGYYRFRTWKLQDTINSMLNSVGFSNYFPVNGDTWTNNGIYGNARVIQLRWDDLFAEVADLKTWLSTHNTSVYYVLQTPEITEITNTELIKQLEAIELLEGINNIRVTGNLASKLQLHYNYVIEETIEDLIFNGIVKNSADMELNPFKPHYCSLQILDPSTLLSEGDLLNFVIANKTITEGINQVIGAISDYGFVAGNIQIPNDSVIGAYSTLEKSPYDVFNYFANISGTRWGTRMIDEDTTAIDFYDPELLEDLGTIECTKEYFGINKISELNYDFSTTDYRNKQIITSDEVFGNIEQTQTIIADGYSTQFNVENKIGRIIKITTNGVESTFCTKSEQELGISADYYYTPTETSFSSINLISTGSIIVVTYIPIIKGREIVNNSSESTRIFNQLNRKGTISRYENRNDVTSSSELMKVAQSYIKFKGMAEISLNIESRKDFLKLGGKYTFNSPINDLNGEYLVKTKNTKILQNSELCQIVYEYVLTNSFDTENEINYFDNQRAKLNGNIGDGETITRNIDLESASSIKFYDTSIEETEVINPTSLDFTLDGVLI